MTSSVHQVSSFYFNFSEYTPHFSTEINHYYGDKYYVFITLLPVVILPCEVWACAIFYSNSQIHQKVGRWAMSARKEPNWHQKISERVILLLFMEQKDYTTLPPSLSLSLCSFCFQNLSSPFLSRPLRPRFPILCFRRKKEKEKANGVRFFPRQSSICLGFHTLCLPRVSPFFFCLVCICIIIIILLLCDLLFYNISAVFMDFYFLLTSFM